MAKKDLAKAKQPDLVPAFEDMSSIEGMGFENLDATDFVVPYLQLVQKGSAAVDKDSPGYIEGAETGCYINSSTGEVYAECEIVPCAVINAYVHWRDMNAGGGFLGKFEQKDPFVQNSTRDGGKLIPNDFEEENTCLSQVKEFYVLIIGKDGSTQKAILSLASTNLRPARKWLTAMQSLMIEGPDGTRRKAPMFGYSHVLSSVAQSNAQHTWRIIKPTTGRNLFAEGENAILNEAIDFYKQVNEGLVKAAEPVEQDTVDEEPEF